MKTLREEMVKKEYTGCPCGMRGDCCRNKNVRTAEHECSDEAVCEGCYMLECLNCGATCSHEL